MQNIKYSPSLAKLMNKAAGQYLLAVVGCLSFCHSGSAMPFMCHIVMPLRCHSGTANQLESYYARVKI